MLPSNTLMVIGLQAGMALIWVEAHPSCDATAGQSDPSPQNGSCSFFREAQFHLALVMLRDYVNVKYFSSTVQKYSHFERRSQQVLLRFWWLPPSDLPIMSVAFLHPGCQLTSSCSYNSFGSQTYITKSITPHSQLCCEVNQKRGST